jgi:flagellar biosynthetic protein FlhB
MEIFMRRFGCSSRGEGQGKKFIFDLQLFAGEKTEEATPKKKSQAREEGQVPKSQEINSALVILIAFFSLKSFGGYLYAETAKFTVKIFSLMGMEITIESVMNLILMSMIVLVKTAFVIMCLLLLTGLVVNFFQVGFLFTLKPLEPKLSKINPISGAQRLFSLRSLNELAKSIIKIVVIGYFIIDFLKEKTLQLPKMMMADLQSSMDFLVSSIFSIGFKICEVLIILAVLDYAYQIWQHNKSLRMSKQDIKDENKQTEGDPLIKSKIRQKQRQMAMSRMMKEVPKADVIITNPTHFAVALKYEAGMIAPVVVAKGQDLVAQRIKEIAREANVAMVENRPLARALFAATEVGGIVPPELYKSVAEVLAYVYRLKPKTKYRKMG